MFEFVITDKGIMLELVTNLTLNVASATASRLTSRSSSLIIHKSTIILILLIILLIVRVFMLSYISLRRWWSLRTGIRIRGRDCYVSNHHCFLYEFLKFGIMR